MMNALYIHFYESKSLMEIERVALTKRNIFTILKKLITSGSSGIIPGNGGSVFKSLFSELCP